ncbi:putative acetyl-CoA synthetase [Basidiobolus meristosporus CBS 931.73]|uniref:Acetyl-coenzyme A synthetase n=1 Tax=Basidiobolus meristosporus CBS 931.73 TaxID=1314790 RepID=A0A1Y1YK69_9FUNG|nr:putative acetyl-CoA synthetase [Basidiobolus meristosporus CBS 931.73]|eukprot:ORX98146.1 putative acetyl-CoA synthetase [Basidiobolus meristosporus CBS 931.73]
MIVEQSVHPKLDLQDDKHKQYDEVSENQCLSIPQGFSDPVNPVPAKMRDPGLPTPHISWEKYHEMYKRSIENPDAFFSELSKELLHWFQPFGTISSGSFSEGDVAFFHDGEINACYNCVDRHALKTPNKVAIIYEPDDPNDEVLKLTYGQLLREVSRLANLYRSYGLKKGDTVAIYLPMIPEAVISMLACARIGLVHNLIFSGFSSDSLAERIQDASCRLLITSDEGKRGGKSIQTKRIADEALKSCPTIEKVIVVQRTGNPDVPMTPERDGWWHEELQKARPYCVPTPMHPEDPLFLLYTSGSTGKPKGVLHTTGGYLLGTTATVKYIFDLHPNDIFGCMADIGWITGHSYIVYGPLSNGVTTVLFESMPNYPNGSRYWDLISKHKITQFYTAPTAIRALKRLGDHLVEGYDLSSLRVIGSVGEPINPEAWAWYNEVVGKGQCAVVDTYWQTETGSIIVTPLPGATPTKAGSAALPFFGIDAVILDPHTGQELKGNDVTGVLAIRKPWPSMARTVYNDHQRYLNTYMRVYPGYYFTGDGATRDKDGYIWIRGRVDDVINVSGHRLSTAEIEAALNVHESVSESAVVGINDELTGQAICCFLTLKPEYVNEDEATIKKALVTQTRKVIGPFATPKKIIIVEELPKTRSGKIVRRVLRKIIAGEADSLGDLSTLADPSIVDELIAKVSSSA